MIPGVCFVWLVLIQRDNNLQRTFYFYIYSRADLHALPSGSHRSYKKSTYPTHLWSCITPSATVLILRDKNNKMHIIQVCNFIRFSRNNIIKSILERHKI